MCETIGNLTTDGKFVSQSKQVADSHNWKTNKNPQAKQDEGRWSKDKINMQDYLNSSKGKN